jgi:chemotaxis protein methyltransferase CheR
MYFTPQAMRTVVDRFTRALSPGGYLFLGPAETLRGISHDYHLRRTHDAFFYQRRQEDLASVSRTPTLPPPIFTARDDSWADAIARATERIAQLSRDTRASTEPHEERLFAPQPASPPEPSPSLHAAREMVRQERYIDALSALNALADEERSDPDVQLLRAVSLTNSGKVNEAEQLCREVLAGDDLNPEARYLLALCLEHAGDPVSAIEQDRAAIYLDPRFAMPHLHLGLLNKRLGNHTDTRRAFRQAFALLPGEDASRLLLFGGGFTRETLLRLCEAELRVSGSST